MTLLPMDEDEATEATRAGESGLGALATERGNLPLESVAARIRITGLVSRIELTQGFRNPHDVPLEATYIFPLPDRAAVTALRLTAAGRTVEAALQERGQAREAYDQAIAEGRRAAIAEEERPDVFTMRVGNILPGERVSVALTMVGPLSYEDGEATFRLPLVVAPRYIPGTPSGSTVGDGYAADTDAVPDASRITPPVLLPGFPNPVRLSIGVDLDPGGLPLGAVRSSLHAVVGEGGHLEIQPGERLNRDFVLRIGYGEPDAAASSLTVSPDADGEQGTWRLTILPPTTAAPPRPRDVVLVLDRSGSMGGWKMVAARRAAARIVDTLTGVDRFAVLAFDNQVEQPPGLGAGLHQGSDRNRFQAVGYLSTVEARGGTELVGPLTTGLALLTDPARDRVLVLVTDGQVGNEDQILRRIGPALAGVRVHTVGIDQAVNAGFLGRLATIGGGRCELVESADRLDEAMERIHRRIGAPSVTGLAVNHGAGAGVLADTVSPARLPDLFPGAPLVVTGRYQGTAPVSLEVTGRTRPGEPWAVRAPAATVAEPSLASVWARAHLRDLEDRYASMVDGHTELERRIVATSLRFGVLCRFTAWVALDERVVVENGERHRVIQPVEPAAGWDMLRPVEQPAMMLAAYAAPMAAAPRPARMAPSASGASGSATLAGSAPADQGLFRKMGRVGAGKPEEAALDLGPLVHAERERLREAAEAPDYERREVLADLGSRLDAIIDELQSHGVAPDRVELVRALVADLAEDRLAGLDADELRRLWERASAVLESLLVTPASEGGPVSETGPASEGGPASQGGPAGGPRKPFWKR